MSLLRRTAPWVAGLLALSAGCGRMSFWDRQGGDTPVASPTADGGSGRNDAGSSGEQGGNDPGCASLRLDAPLTADVSEVIWKLAVADLNRDGIEDLVMVGGELGVSIVFGLPDGGLAPPVAAPTNDNQAYDVVVADLNQDGWPDLITVGSSVSLLLNRGDGALLPAKQIGTGLTVYSAAVGDFDGDGQPDIVTCSGEVGLSLYFALGGSNFSPGTPLSAAGPPSMRACFDVIAADFNGDSLPDLAWTPYPDTTGPSAISVSMGSGRGDWSPIAYVRLPDSPVWLKAGDLNGDGAPDLAATTRKGVAVVLNSGGGVFGAAAELSPPVDNLSTIDFVNLDSRCLPAIVASGSALCDQTRPPAGEVLLFLNDGAGGFAAGASLQTGNSRPMGAVGFRPGKERRGLILGDGCLEGLTFLPNREP